VKIYSVYDKKMMQYMPVWVARTDGAAIRVFSDEVKRSDSQMHAHPEDFSLWRVGEFDDICGVVEADREQLLDGTNV